MIPVLALRLVFVNHLLRSSNLTSVGGVPAGNEVALAPVEQHSISSAVALSIFVLTNPACHAIVREVRAAAASTEKSVQRAVALNHSH